MSHRAPRASFFFLPSMSTTQRDLCGGERLGCEVIWNTTRQTFKHKTGISTIAVELERYDRIHRLASLIIRAAKFFTCCNLRIFLEKVLDQQ